MELQERISVRIEAFAIKFSFSSYAELSTVDNRSINMENWVK